jgi:hypothetical protein
MGEAADRPQPASKAWVFVFGLYLIILNLLLIYVLFRLWPGHLPLDEKETHGVVNLIPGLWTPDVWVEARYLALVTAAGALGSYIHLATSFADYLGNRQFYSSWKWWYALRPFIGSTLALAVYFAARGGLISGGAGAGDLSPYGVCALAGLSGMFSRQATDKLREVFENLFKTDKTQRKDALEPNTPRTAPNSQQLDRL